MWSYDANPLNPLRTGSGRRAFLGLLLLAGCGFVPAYSTDGPARALLGQVRAADPVDQAGFDFVKQIEARLGRADVAVYDLTYSISTGMDGVAITGDGATTRYNIVGVVTWTLLKAGQRVAGGSVDTFASYSATGSTVAGLMAREDAMRRLMGMLADKVVTALLAAPL